MHICGLTVTRTIHPLGTRRYTITNKLIISRDVVFDEKGKWKSYVNQSNLEILQGSLKILRADDESSKTFVAVLEDDNGESDTPYPTSPSSSTFSTSSDLPLRKWGSLREIYQRSESC